MKKKFSFTIISGLLLILCMAFKISSSIDKTLLIDKMWVGTKQNKLYVTAQKFKSDGTYFNGSLGSTWNWIGDSDTIHIKGMSLPFDIHIDTLTETHLVYTIVKGMFLNHQFYFDVKKK